MTPLPGWGCSVCGILLLTLAEIEAHEIHALPVDHLHVETYDRQPTAMLNLGIGTSSGAAPSAPSPSAWAPVYDVPTWGRPSPNPDVYGQPTSAAVMWAQIRRSRKDH